jgi:uncharacterized protein YggE
MRRLVPIGLVSAVLLAVLLSGADGAGGAPAAATAHSIVVTGSGSVTSVPDRAQLSFGVSSTAKTASAALRANAAEMTRVIASVKSQGIAAADVRTELVSLSPVYSQGGDAIVGYTASNSVGVTVRNLDKIGALIDAAVDAGANQVNGPNLVRSDANALYRQALRAAISNARGKAQTIAKASGLALRRITDVTESGGPAPVPEAAKVSAAPSTPIEPGTQLVEATVTVTFSVA